MIKNHLSLKTQHIAEFHTGRHNYPLLYAAVRIHMAGLATNNENFLNHKEIEIWRSKKVRIEGAFFAEHL